ncbi:MAG: ABC transporter permease [Methylobacterium sp.]|nr:ABC transporter permease [Methylobacterium sp.]
MRSLAVIIFLTMSGLPSQAQPKPPLRLGLLADMSGVYSEVGGMGSLMAMQLAVQDFGGEVLGRRIEIVSADQQSKVDVSSALARQWYDQDGVEAIMDVSGTAAALAVFSIARDKNKIAFGNITAGIRLTNEACTPNTVHYTYDTYALAKSTTEALLKQGVDTWYFITADYAFGHDFERDASTFVKARGGQVLGAVRSPFGTLDFSSYLLQAQASGSKAIAFATAGSDTANALKQAGEFGLRDGRSRLVGLLVYINEINALGLEATQGTVLTNGFYWDRDDETRAFSKRYFERMKLMPNMAQAGIYSATMHYLNAVKAAGTSDTAAVMRAMKDTPINDFFAKNGRIREDGRMVHDMYLYEVKKPSESKYAWDYLKLVSVIPGDQAFQPLSESRCPLMKK